MNRKLLLNDVSNWIKTLWIFHANKLLASPMIWLGLRAEKVLFSFIAIDGCFWTKNKNVYWTTCSIRNVCTAYNMGELCGVFAALFAMIVWVLWKIQNAIAHSIGKMCEKWWWMLLIAFKRLEWKSSPCTLPLPSFYSRPTNTIAACQSSMSHRHPQILLPQTQAVSGCIELRMWCRPSECDDVLHG